MVNTALNIFGNRLRSLREQEYSSRDEFSEKFDLHPATVGRWERGERLPSAEELDFLAQSMGRPVAWFFTDPEKEKEPRTVTPSEALQVLTQFIRSSDERADSLQRELADARREIARLKGSQLPTSYVAEVDTSHYARRRSRAKPEQNNEHKESS